MLKKMVLSLVVLVAASVPAWAQVTVTGEGITHAVPDVATVSVSVVTESKFAVTALDNNSDSMSKVIKSLKALGIKKEELKTSTFRLEQRYVEKVNDTGGKEMVANGYTVINDLTISVCQTDTLGKVLDNLVKSGVNRVNSVSYGFSDPVKLLDQAREAAIKDARRKAELYVKTAGSKLGAVKTIAEYSARGYGAYSEDSSGYSNTVRGGRAVVEPGSRSIKVSVTVVWDVVPTK